MQGVFESTLTHYNSISWQRDTVKFSEFTLFCLGYRALIISCTVGIRSDLFVSWFSGLSIAVNETCKWIKGSYFVAILSIFTGVDL